MEHETTERSESEPTVQMIGTLPPWKGISAYCKALFEGITRQWDQLKFTGWKSLYPRSLYPGGDPKTDEDPVEGDNIERTLSWYDPVSWIRVGLDSDVQLVHAQWWSYPLAVPYISIFIIGKILGKTVLITVHNVEPHEQNLVTTFFNNAVYAFGDKFVVHSEENKSQLAERRSVSPEDVYVISHPVIGPEKEGISKRESLRELGLESDTNAVLFFGNIREYKGLDSLIEMVDNINEDNDVHLVIAGKCWVDWEPYRSSIESRDLTDKVHRYPGYIPEDRLELFFNAADAVALPYEYFDAQSGVAGLADHFGAVSIGTDEGGLAEQVDVVASDQEEFERAIITAINSDLGKKPVSDDAAEKHVRLYEQLLERSSE